MLPQFELGHVCCKISSLVFGRTDFSVEGCRTELIIMSRVAINRLTTIELKHCKPESVIS